MTMNTVKLYADAMTHVADIEIEDNPIYVIHEGQTYVVVAPGVYQIPRPPAIPIRNTNFSVDPNIPRFGSPFPIGPTGP